jgi:tetratricopeptide (TPR) repeat protein
MRHQNAMHSGAAPGIDKALALVVGRNARRPADTLPYRLNALFDDLKRDAPLRDPGETMELIWAIWIAHQDNGAAHRMVAAVEAIAAGARDLAKPILDDLVRDFPDWAEAWNKRATLAFVERRYEDCIADIVRTLELEPRHFGAILGFAQICLRQGRKQEAKAAFEIAMELNPHISGIRQIVDELAVNRRMLH